MVRRWSLCLLIVCALLPGGDTLGAQPSTDDLVASMSTPRRGHTATRLPDGRVLVTGGNGPGPGYQSLNSAEIYDPRTDSWHPAASMTQQRTLHSATLLRDGRVLIVGGTTAEFYDPPTDRWSPIASPHHVHYSSPAVLLAGGSVLVAGGVEPKSSETNTGQDCTQPHTGASRAAETYDPATGTWQAVAALPDRRTSHTLTALADGSAVAIGGWCLAGVLSSIERFDPTTRRWQSLPPLAAPRHGHTATLLSDGRLLVAGGTSDRGGNFWLNTALIFDPHTQAWTTVAPLNQAHQYPKAVLLADRRLLVFGHSASEIYDPSTNRWTLVGALREPSGQEPTALLADGRVFFVRGAGGAAEIFDPLARRWVESELERATRACFPTGYCVRGPFQGYWQDYLRSPISRTGYPISGEFVEVLEDGEPHIVQYFERVRLEHHPHPGRLPAFQFGQFGRRVRPADPPTSPLPGARIFPETGPGPRYFAETGHNLQGRFLDHWWNEGSIIWYGYPLSEEFEEELEDGKVYLVQYFERARFEYHPENEGTPYVVLLGHFGRRILAEASPVP